jgi:hypothetical protein
MPGKFWNKFDVGACLGKDNGVDLGHIGLHKAQERLESRGWIVTLLDLQDQAHRFLRSCGAGHP